jgi:hypothetical protein
MPFFGLELARDLAAFNLPARGGAALRGQSVAVAVALMVLSQPRE